MPCPGPGALDRILEMIEDDGVPSRIALFLDPLRSVPP